MAASPLSSLTEALSRLDLEAERGRADALSIVAALGATQSIGALRSLLPALASPACSARWPAPPRGLWAGAARRTGTGPREEREDSQASRVALAAAGAGAIATILKGRSTNDLFAIDQRMRASLPIAHWDTLTAEGLDRVVPAGAHAPMVLGLLAGHPSGHVRELAVKRLAALGEEGLPWLLVRCVDWVPEVRDRAVAAVDALLSAGASAALVDALPLVRRLRGFTRVDAGPVADRIVRCLAREADGLLRTGLTHWDRLVRRATVEILLTTELLRPADVARGLADPDVIVRLRVARSVKTDASAESVHLRALMCAHRTASVRALGLELSATADLEAALPHLRRAVDDPARRVRELARHVLGSQPSPPDFQAHYQRAIEAGPLTTGVIEGLGEVGVAADWERLVPALDSASPAVVRAALRSMRRLDRAETRELRLMLVDDERPGVSKEAAQSLGHDSRDSDEPVVREYLASPHPHVRTHAVRLASRLSGWAPALVLLEHADERLQPKIAAGFERWLRRRWLAGAGPPQEEEARLRGLLSTTTILGAATRDDAVRLLDFLARLRG